MTEAHPRWDAPVEVEDLDIMLDQSHDGVLHAAASAADADTLCERDGPRLTHLTHVRLNLDGPDAARLASTVTCPGCVAWMRA